MHSFRMCTSYIVHTHSRRHGLALQNVKCEASLPSCTRSRLDGLQAWQSDLPLQMMANWQSIMPTTLQYDIVIDIVIVLVQIQGAMRATSTIVLTCVVVDRLARPMQLRCWSCPTADTLDSGRTLHW